MNVRFKNLDIGDTFDFIDDNSKYNSFFRTCEKISARRYKCSLNNIYTIGSVNCSVYHVVERKDKKQ